MLRHFGRLGFNMPQQNIPVQVEHLAAAALTLQAVAMSEIECHKTCTSSRTQQVLATTRTSTVREVMQPEVRE